MRLRNVPRRYLMLGGLVGIGCGLAVSELCGQGPLHDRAPPPCVLNGPCLPNREAWGYYSPKWRRWPGTVVATELSPGAATGLEGTDVPSAVDEDVRVPLPTSPSTGVGPAPGRGITPAPVEPGPIAPVPFEVPTPAGPPLGGIGPGAGLDAPVPNGPLPGAPLPNVAPPAANGIVPQPGAGLPNAPNPFDGSNNSGGSGPLLDADPPPTLPPSLRSSRRVRDAQRATEQNGAGPSFAAGLTRLPNPARRPESAGRYEVRQASATVWASGMEDIRPADPNAGRIEQAIHHEPVE